MCVCVCVCVLGEMLMEIFVAVLKKGLMIKIVLIRIQPRKQHI